MEKEASNQQEETKKDLKLANEKKYIYHDQNGVVHTTSTKYYISED